MAKISKNQNKGHQWRFFRAGGFDQVRLDRGIDLINLDQLDQKLWTALACPINGSYFDSRTLSLIDSDKDERVRAPELLSAIQWTSSLLKNPDDLLKSSSSITIDQIQDSHDEGKSLCTAARNVLRSLGKTETDCIDINDTVSMEKILQSRPHNGDGIISGDCTTDESLRKSINDIISGIDPIVDHSGKQGITKELIELFFKHAQEYDIWIKETELDNSILFLGENTPDAALALSAVRAKIDDFFTRVSLAAFDEHTINALNHHEKEFAIINQQNITPECSEISNLPLALIAAGKSLHLASGINPAWKDKLATFTEKVIYPVLGNLDTLDETSWNKLCDHFAPYFSWQTRCPSHKIEKLGTQRIRELLNSKTREELLKQIDLDLEIAPTIKALESLEKLVRFNRDLHSLCTNFINFKDFYTGKGGAIFQAGTLYLDQRSCNLCMYVADVAKHSVMASMAGTYLVYCECRRKNGTEKMNIVAAFTNGESENLIIGRNGIFYDRKGNDWDATIIKIIENPISLRQAFWLPYKNFVRMIETQVAKRAMAAETQSTTKLEQSAIAAANVDNSTKIAPPKKFDIGIVAALGVAAGALGTFIATLLGYAGGIVKLGPLAIIGASLGVIFLISGPSLILAFIKLRKRNLGPILDAGGWAVNAKAKINVPFGAELTNVAALPAGSLRDIRDPYAEKKSPWPKIILFAVLLYAAYVSLDKLGFVNEWTSGRIGKQKEIVSKTVVIEKD